MTKNRGLQPLNDRWSNQWKRLKLARAVLSPRLSLRKQNHTWVRICVIFNPAARGNKAKRFRRHLDAMGGGVAFKATAGPGDAQRLAAAAVREGYEIVAAAGGDGTLNEVLNGLASTPGGLDRVRLGVLPLGTVNVFAREFNISLRLARAWETLRHGRELRVDLGCASFTGSAGPERRYFAQLAGAGLDARAIELVSWQLKKKAGKLAYVFAGLKALTEAKPKAVATANGQRHEGELVLIGNGKFYGGSFPLLPAADPADGLLDVCVFPTVEWGALLRCVPSFVTRQRVSEKVVRRFQATSFQLTSDKPMAFELDGEWVGHLPVTFSVERQRLRVVVP